jgi:hypothetical protein
MVYSLELKSEYFTGKYGFSTAVSGHAFYQFNTTCDFNAGTAAKVHKRDILSPYPYYWYLP